MSIRRKKFRRATVGNWILLGKLSTKVVECSMCGRKLWGEQLIYSNIKTGKRAVICQRCVGEFEQMVNPDFLKKTAEQRRAAYSLAKEFGATPAQARRIRQWRSPKLFRAYGMAVPSLAERREMGLVNPLTQKRYEKFVEMAWKAWDKYESLEDPYSEKGTKLYNIYLDRKRMVEKMSNQFHPSLRPKLPNPKNPKSLYEQFHGVAPSKVTPVYYQSPPKKLIKVGRLRRIDYEPEIPSKLSKTIYFHHAGDLGDRKSTRSNVILATDEKGKHLYLVRDRNTKYPIFTGRGILG